VLTTTITITSSRNNIAKKQRKNQNKTSKFRVNFSSFFRAFSNSANLDLHGQNVATIRGKPREREEEAENCATNTTALARKRLSLSSAIA
jgi:hypothetical protein